MELIAIVLSGLFSLFSNGGWIIDLIASKTLSDRVVSIEEQAIRIDNTPNFQLAQGQIDKVRIACRGIQLNSYLKVDTLELETDAIALNVKNLNIENLQSLRSSLIKPLQGVGKIILTQADLTQALQSPALQKQLQQALNNLIASKAGSSTIAYEVSALEIKLYPNNRVKIQLQLRRFAKSQENNQKLAISLEFGMKVLGGKKIKIVEPVGTINDRPMSSRLLRGFAEGISDRLDLSKIESQGILTRLLQLEITADKIELIAFARMETKPVPITSTEK